MHHRPTVADSFSLIEIGHLSCEQIAEEIDLVRSARLSGDQAQQDLLLDRLFKSSNHLLTPAGPGLRDEWDGSASHLYYDYDIFFKRG